MTSEEPYLTPVREAGSRSITLNVNLTPGSGPLSEAQRDDLLIQITNTLEQMDTPPIVRLSEQEVQSHLPSNVVQLGTSISSPLGHGSMEEPSDKEILQYMSSVETTEIPTQTPPRSARLGAEDLSSSVSVGDVMLQTQLLTMQITQTMTEATRETEAKNNLIRLASTSCRDLMQVLTKANGYIFGISDAVSVVSFITPINYPVSDDVDNLLEYSTRPCIVGSGLAKIHVTKLHDIRVAKNSPPDVIRQSNVYFLETIAFLLWEGNLPSDPYRRIPYLNSMIEQITLLARSVRDCSPGEYRSTVSLYLSKLDLVIKHYRGFGELQKNKFLNDTVSNFPNLFREYYKRNYQETYKQPGYLWNQFRRDTLPVAGAFNTMSLDQLQMSKSSELAIARYVAMDQEAVSESHMIPKPVANAIEETATGSDPVINSSGGGGPNRKIRQRLNTGGRPSSQVCWNYQKGTCKNGSQCVFRHITEPKSEVRTDSHHMTLELPIANSTSLPSRNRRNSNMMNHCIDTGTSRICLPSKAMLDQPDDCAASRLKVKVADGGICPVEGEGKFGNKPALVMSTFGSILLPTSAVTDHSTVVIFDQEMYVVPKFRIRELRGTLYKLALNSNRTNTFRIMKRNGIFPLRSTELARKIVDGPQKPQPIVAQASSYYTTKTDSQAELVQFWHESLGHIGKDDLISMVKMKPKGKPIGFPKALNEKVIRKWFNNACEACKASTLRQKPISNEAGTEFSPGECFAMDVVTFDEDSLGFHRDAIVGLDVGSDKPFVYLLQNKANLHVFVDKVRRMYLGKGHKLKVLRVDKAFISTTTVEYCTEHAIEIRQPNPYEHAQLGPAEGLIRILSDDVNKLLYTVKNENPIYKKLWSLALLEAVRLRGLKATKKKPGVSRDMAWGDRLADFTKTPHLPFASKVLAWLPLTMQTKLSGRSFRGLVVGPAPFTKGGILVLNLETNKIVARRSFTVLGAYDHDFGNIYGKADHHIIMNADDKEIYYDAVHHNLSDSPTEVSHTMSEFSDEDLSPVLESSPEDTLPSCNVDSEVENTSIQPELTVIKSKKVKKEKVFRYRSVVKGDAQAKEKKYFQKIGLYFTDRSEDGGLRKIVDVQRCTSLGKGRGSRSLFYKLYDPDMFPYSSPNDDVDHFWIPCSEVYGHKTTIWEDNMNVSHMVEVVAIGDIVEDAKK